MIALGAIWTFGWVLVMVNTDTIVYPGRSALLAYNPARGEFPVQSLFGRGFFTYTDENGISKIVTLEPNPLLGVRIIDKGQPQIEIGRSLNLENQTEKGKQKVDKAPIRKQDRLKPIKEFDENPFVDSLDDIPSSTSISGISPIIFGSMDSMTPTGEIVLYPQLTDSPNKISPRASTQRQAFPSTPSKGIISPGNPFLPPNSGFVFPNQKQPPTFLGLLLDPSSADGSAQSPPVAPTTSTVTPDLIFPNSPLLTGFGAIPNRPTSTDAILSTGDSLSMFPNPSATGPNGIESLESLIEGITFPNNPPVSGVESTGTSNTGNSFAQGASTPTAPPVSVFPTPSPTGSNGVESLESLLDGITFPNNPQVPGVESTGISNTFAQGASSPTPLPVLVLPNPLTSSTGPTAVLSTGNPFLQGLSLPTASSASVFPNPSPPSTGSTGISNTGNSFAQLSATPSPVSLVPSPLPSTAVLGTGNPFLQGLLLPNPSPASVFPNPNTGNSIAQGTSSPTLAPVAVFPNPSLSGTGSTAISNAGNAFAQGPSPVSVFPRPMPSGTGSTAVLGTGNPFLQGLGIPTPSPAVLSPGNPFSQVTTSPSPISVFPNPSQPAAGPSGVLGAGNPFLQGIASPTPSAFPSLDPRPSVIAATPQFNIDNKNPFLPSNPNIGFKSLHDNITLAENQEAANSLPLETTISQLESTSPVPITLQGDPLALPQQVRDTPEVEKAKLEHFLAHEMALAQLKIAREQSDDKSTDSSAVYSTSATSEPSTVEITEQTLMLTGAGSEALLQAVKTSLE